MLHLPVRSVTFLQSGWVSLLHLYVPACPGALHLCTWLGLGLLQIHPGQFGFLRQLLATQLVPGLGLLQVPPDLTPIVHLPKSQELLVLLTEIIHVHSMLTLEVVLVSLLIQ